MVKGRFYSKKTGIIDWYELDRPEDFSDVAEYRQEGLFHIGQHGDKETCRTLYCKQCGGKEFNVGNGSHYTAVKCVKCGWEACVHEG